VGVVVRRGKRFEKGSEKEKTGLFVSAKGNFEGKVLIFGRLAQIEKLEGSCWEESEGRLHAISPRKEKGEGIPSGSLVDGNPGKGGLRSLKED